MPIIPRYQPQSGPSVGGLNYAGAYSPPDGSDWRLLARAAQAAGSVLDALPHKPAAAAPAARAGANQENHLLGQAEEVRWRRQQLQADEGALDVEAVSQSRRQAADALPQGARLVFDALTGPREAGFAAAASARASARVREASQALSLERQALGLDEYQALAEVAPEQALAALGSASGELAARLGESGANPEEIQRAQRELLSQAHARRISSVLADDPDHAAALLSQHADLLGRQDFASLEQEITSEQARTGARAGIADLAARTPDLLASPDAFIAEAEQMAGDDPARREAYRDAAAGRLRLATAARAEAEASRWSAVEPFIDLANGAGSWTDIPGAVWTGLSPAQRAAVKAHFAATPGPEPDRPDDGLLVQTAGPRLVMPGDQALADRMDAPPPDPLSRQSRALNLYLDRTRPGGEWRAHRENGHFFRLGQRVNPVTGRHDYGVIYATPEEAQQEVERRLGVLPRQQGYRSKREEDLRKDEFGYMSDEIGSTWPTLKISTAVDWDFVAVQESSSIHPKLSVYFPTANSGPTIAHGVDIGVRNANDLNNLGLPPDLTRKLAPYLQKRGQVAKSYVAAHPLTLTRAEADQVDQAVRNYEMGNLVPAFDKASKVGAFRDLPERTQTAIASVYFNLGTSKVPGYPKDFWKQITEGDWEGAHANLTNGKWQNGPRRGREAALIRKDIDDGLFAANPP